MSEMNPLSQAESTGVALYESADGHVSLEVRTDDETVWLTQVQLATLFGRDVTVIRRHISNARREELADLSTSAKFARVHREGERFVERQVEHYNLDMIISVGYRVKSVEGIRFRKWATELLRSYLIKGYTLNAKRLEELGAVVQILSRSSDELISGVAEVLTGYLPGLALLRDYDEGALVPAPRAEPTWTLTLDEARKVIARVGSEFDNDTLFGQERGEGLAGILETIYGGFGGQEFYPTVEEKAANLLYMIVKDHPLADGNKRSAAALFVTFLARNGHLFDAAGMPSVSNNALAAITLLIAMSDPKEKHLMIDLVVRMIQGETE